MNIQGQALSPAFGEDILTVDVSRRHIREQVEDFCDSWRQRQLVLFRNQTLNIFFLLTVVIMVMTCLIVKAHAAFPEKPITILVGAKAGGNIDLSTRILAKHLEETLGTNVIVDNRPGGGGARMATQLKAARPDGYTLGLNISVTWSFTPHTSRQPAYGLNDFSYIASIARAQEAFVVSTEKPWLTFSEMIDYAKQGNTIVYGSQAPSTRLMMTDIASKAGIKVKILNGKGGQEIIPWLLNGQVDIGFLGGIQEGLVREGKLRVVASTGESRLKHHPDIATLKEQGFTSIPAALFMLAGPKGMDEVIKDRIAQAVGAALTQEDVIALFENRLFLPIEFHGPGELNKILQADDAYFSELLNSKVTADEKS